MKNHIAIRNPYVQKDMIKKGSAITRTTIDLFFRQGAKKLRGESVLERDAKRSASCVDATPEWTDGFPKIHDT